MRWLFLALMMIGICLAGTTVNAKREYRCDELKTKIYTALSGHKLAAKILNDKTDEWVKDEKISDAEHERTSKAFVELLDLRLTHASKWATVYAALCKT